MAEATTKSGKSTARGMASRGSAKSGSMEMRTKEDLYREAQKAGIEGRSRCPRVS
ncbi:rho termination factor [Streptomyces sp. PSAA01]|uniref:rho termination factor n=1 Tax=Streptomyces sp. PSAA01 TaxID=2912762 RepID=UPI001F43BECE|nr:rho termination factor [Streptomyces sp. PSAA01]MCG0290475.1 rho termination factor [Streptomyces sp. PSAA01]